MNKELINFHIKNGYFIKAQRTKQSNGCFIEYPKSKMKVGHAVNIDPFISVYLIEQQKIKFYKEKEKNGGQSKSIEVPFYAIRTIVAEDILLEVIRQKLSHELIFCYDKDGKILENENDLTQIIDPPEGESDKVKEKSLLGLLGFVIQGLDYSQQARELEVYEGYKIVKQIFDVGGICDV